MRKSHAKREQSLITGHQVSTFLGGETSARPRRGPLAGAPPDAYFRSERSESWHATSASRVSRVSRVS